MKPAWTWRKFIKEMKQAGWDYMGQGVFSFANNKRQFNGWGFDADYGEKWERWADAKQTPFPF